jgi:trk system potassium uptake protein TrkA
VRVLIIGAGRVGTAVAAALAPSHDVTVIDLDGQRLAALSMRIDILAVEGSGTSRAALLRAGAREADLVIAATDRDDSNIVAALMARAICKGKIVARTHSYEYVEAWRNGHLDLDFVVSSEQESAQAVARAVGYPTAVQTDVFAGGLVEMIEYVVDVRSIGIAGRTVAEIGVPDESVIASIFRGDRLIIPGGANRIEAGDRLVLIASPAAARDWARRLAPGHAAIDDVVVVGAGATGIRIAALLAELGLHVRLVERNADRARRAAEDLPDVRVLCADGTDKEFLEREGVGRCDALIAATDDDARDLLVGLIGRRLGARTVIAIVADPTFIPVFEDAGIDRALNERLVTAEEIVRFTHDPRTTGFAMLEGDRAEILEIEVSAGSSVLGKPFHTRPLSGAIVGAIMRDGCVVFPRADDALRLGDRAIIFADARFVSELEGAL